MKAIPAVKKYMTTTPYSINSESTVEEAAKVMKKNGIRHLPVVIGKKYGLVSDRDLKFVMSLVGFDAKTAKVKDICEEAPYVTEPSTSISLVSAELAERRVGSALIVDNGHLVGILTTTDVCRALNDLCEGRLHS